MQPAHDAPDFPAEPDHLLALPQPESVRAVDYLLIDLVGGARRDLSDLPLAYAPAVGYGAKPGILIGAGKPLFKKSSYLNCVEDNSILPLAPIESIS
jgi:hypothetical protein